jgi:protein ImuB
MKFEEALELEDPVELLEPLAFVMNRLLEQICARLAARALAANQLQLTLELAAHEDDSAIEQAQKKRVHQRTLQFPVPIQDGRTFLKLLQLDLSAHPPGGPVSKIMIAAEPAPPRFAQSGLFMPHGPEPERLELTLARIRGITGDDRVGSAELLDTHAPNAFRMTAFHPTASTAGKPNATAKAHPAAMRIFRPPREAKVQTKNGVPVRVFLNGNANEVTAAAGPWRKTGGWWNEQAWTRDEWDVQLKTPEQLPRLMRLYRDLSSAKWLVEGEFD